MAVKINKKFEKEMIEHMAKNYIAKVEKDLSNKLNKSFKFSSLEKNKITKLFVSGKEPKISYEDGKIEINQ